MKSKSLKLKLVNYAKSSLAFDLLALFLIILGSFLIYNTHFDYKGPVLDTEKQIVENKSLGYYPYPLHFDEFNHLSQVKQIVEEGPFENINPQLYEPLKTGMAERGYHILLALILIVTGMPLLSLSLYLPAIFYGIGALLIYIFLSRTFKKPLAGIFTVLFLIFIRSSSNILGFWFLTPSGLTLIFLGAVLLMLYEIRRPLNLYYAGVLSFVSFFIYPIITVLLLLIIFIYFLFEYEFCKYFWMFRKRNVRVSSAQKILIAGGIVALFLFLIIFGRKLIFPPEWTDIATNITIFRYLIFPALILAVVGLFASFKENKFVFSLIGVYSVFGIINSLIFFNYNYGFILPYQRMIFQWGILLSISAGLGLEFLVRLLVNFLASKKRFKFVNTYSKYFAFGLTAIICTLVLFVFLKSYYDVPEKHAIQEIVHPQQIKLLKMINTSSPKAVLADPYFSSAIYPLSKNKAVAALDGNLGGGLDPYIYADFVMNPCKDKWSKTKLTKIDFVITPRFLHCNFLKQVAENDGYYLYIVVPDLLPTDVLPPK